MSNLRIRDGIFFVEPDRHAAGSLVHAGFHVDGPGIPDKPMRVVDLFALVLVLHGEGEFQAPRGVRFPLATGDLFFLEPGVPHRYVPKPGVRWDEFWICFQGPLFAAWQSAGLLSSTAPPIRLREPEYWLHRFMDVFPRENALRLQHPLERACRCNELLGELFAYQESASLLAEDRRWVAMATARLSRREAVREVARAMGCSYDTFRRRFVRLLNEPPGRYRLRRLLQEAARRMVNDRRTNRELAGEFGFSSEFHFSRAFRQHMGFSPQAYRQSAGVSATERSVTPLRK